MPTKNLGVIAEPVAVCACASRRDLREGACSGACDGAWQELALNKYPEMPSGKDPALTRRTWVQGFLNSPAGASFRQANSFIDLA